ncbi:cation:proton antiporter [Pseudonocardia hydrocarbonoxydans]|uniref:Potassium transporter n=1 Tax=Pseudonocardia hydrocarbonoxydans TaxID=76726 RepID=A0A4Y3WJM3_9PSEU|nr:cation:proton antiporter [Pseudonocardia hydrocarbonoxydans]GEC19043.1 potassium transporter [Pseudonocardia hydrocarbonoxydans]
MSHSIALLLELGALLIVLSVLGTIAHRLSLTPVPLYLLAGLAVGEGGLGLVPASATFIETSAQIGLVLLLLVLGLEFSGDQFAEGLRRHRPSVVVDAVLNATPGAIAGLLLGLDAVGVLAMAGVTWVSSSGIVARLLVDLRRLQNPETPSVLAVLVLEDFAMAIYLPVLAVMAAGGTWWQALLGVLVAVGALSMALLASRRWGHRIGGALSHPEPEQLLLRIVGVTLLVAALAETINISAGVGAFLVGLSLTGEITDRAREVLAPVRDLFAAAFFLAIGLSIDATDLLPVLPAALALAAVTAVTKVLTGAYAAGRDGVDRDGRLRAGTALITRGEFSIVVIGLVGAAADPRLGALVAAYVTILATAGPVLTRWADGPRRRRPEVDAQRRRGRRAGTPRAVPRGDR